MGVLSTRYVSRGEAMKMCLGAVPGLDDGDLGDLMDFLFGGERPRVESPFSLANFLIGQDPDEDDPELEAYLRECARKYRQEKSR